MSDLKEITRLATALIRLEDDVATLEEQLKEKKALLTQIAEGDLVEAMESAGVQELNLTNGRKVEIAKSYHASIAEKNREPAFRWLRETGNDGLIKQKVAFTFDRGQDKLAGEVIRRVLKAYPDLQESVEHVEAVHPQTLKAFVKEQMESGSGIPMDVFGIFIRKVAKIGVAKASATKVGEKPKKATKKKK